MKTLEENRFPQFQKRDNVSVVLQQAQEYDVEEENTILTGLTLE